MKRPCVFLVADGTMEQMLKSFLSRGSLEGRLGCQTFDFVSQDVVVDVKNGNTDGGIHRRAHALLHPFLRSHQNAVVMLDKNFGGRLPGAVVREEIRNNLLRNGWSAECVEVIVIDPEVVREEIRNNLLHNGWSAECVEVIVIDPELEAWLWQRGNPHIAREFRYNGSVSLEEFLEAEGLWPSATLKPAKPKEAAGVLLQRYRAGPRIVVYRRIVENISVRGCQDPAFNLLAGALRRWFPVEVA